MSGLPKGWTTSNLPKLISLDGVISDGDWIESKDQDPNGNIRLIQLADIGDGKFLDKSSRYMNEDKASILRCTSLEEGDVLIARMPDPLGRACIFPKIDSKAVTVVDICLVRVGSRAGVSNHLLKYWFNSPIIRNQIAMLATGTTRKRITRKKLTELELPVPPYNEQIRIANKLDSILAKVDKAQARLDKIPAILKRFRQSVLAAATSGELTKEWREENHLEFHIVEKRFEELLVELRNGISTKPNENGAGHPILRINAVRAGIVTQEDVRHLECDSTIVEKYKLLPNDILFTRYNGSLDFVGVCGLLKTINHDTLLYPDKLIRARVTEEVLPEFIEIYFSSPDAREAMTSHVKTTSGQKGISGKDIKNQVVRLPTLVEQKQVVRRVSALLAKADKVEKQYLDAKTRLDRLTQSILVKAFRGELVPQDPNDEPAEKLLERIVAEKEQSKPKKTTRKRATKAKTAEKEQ